MLVVHAEDWTMCPVHALASSFALLNGYGKGSTLFQAFRSSNSDGGVKFSNEKIRLLVAELQGSGHSMTEKLTSHSIRSGAVTHLGEHAKIPVMAMHNRGGWSSAESNMLQFYIRLTSIPDTYCARALSFYDNVDNVEDGRGLCPSTDSLASSSDQALFSAYALKLINVAGLQNETRCALAAILVMNYE